MSNEKNALDAMLAQYEKNNAPKYAKSETAKVYDLKNYFNTYIKEGVKSATKQIRILPSNDGSTPFVEMHAHKVQVDGEWKTFPCLKHEKDEACPFCEARETLLSTGKEADKELAKKYNARKMYVVKVIDREHEEEGVKFWRFNHDYRKEGIYDKIYGVLAAIKKDVTNPDNGRDLLLTINRNQNGVPVVSAVASLDPSVLSEDEETKESWLGDTRTWEDVYSVRTYDYLKIIVEARNLDEVQQILNSGGVYRILLDNFDYETTKKAVQMIGTQCLTESSGNINEKTIRYYAECGVNYISSGALTHSVYNMDLSLKAL